MTWKFARRCYDQDCEARSARYRAVWDVYLCDLHDDLWWREQAVRMREGGRAVPERPTPERVSAMGREQWLDEARRRLESV